MSNSGKVHPEMKKTKNDWPMITYDQSIHKSAQNTLYQAARAIDKDVAQRKWDEFVGQIQLECSSDEQINVMLNNLDDRKQWAPLHYAVDANNVSVFSQLTTGEKRFRCDININGGDGENVLHIAARSQNIWKDEDRQKTVEHTSDASTMATKHHIEIMVVRSDLPEIVHRMLNLGADINDRDDEYRTPLHLAVQANRYSYAAELIVRGADILATSKFKASVLYFALLPNRANGDELTKMVHLILSRAEEIKQTHTLIGLVTLSNETSLARALCHPAVTDEIIKDLLNKNDLINEKQLLVAFDMVASYGGHTEKPLEYLKPLINWLENHGHQATLSQLPHIFCRHDNVSLLKWFNKVTTDKINTSDDGKVSRYMNTVDYAGYTPLLTAVFYKSEKCVQSIFDQMSNNHKLYLLATNEDNENILHICAKCQVEESLFDIIWGKLAEYNIYNYKNDLMITMNVDGNVPLELAARFNNEYMCKNLLNYVKQIPSNVNLHSLIKRTAHEACEAGHLNILKLIILPNSDKQQQMAPDIIERILQMRDEDGYTCLHLAAARNHHDIVDFLIKEAKAEVDAIGNRRLTPLHLACENGCVEIVQFLLKAGASTTLRNAQVYNCLEIAIVSQKQNVVQELFTHSTWKEMMRNAQPIEDTEAFDTPMRKLIRYMPDMAVWLIDNKFTKVVGGEGQKVYKTIYDYEFYEDMYVVKDWYTQDVKLVSEPKTCASLWHTRGVEAIHTCWCCCHSNDLEYRCCCKSKKTDKEEWYTNDAYTLVRNHPLFIVSLQWQAPTLVQHFYHTHLRQTKLRSFGLVFFILSYFFYMAYLGLFTAAVLMGKHPKFFYDKAEVNMTLDLPTCEYVANFLTNNPNVTSEALKTDTYKRVKWALYAILSVFIAKNLLIIFTLFPKVLRIGGSYIEISALVLSYVYILDWFSWQIDVMFRCPVQYQLGAMGLLLGYTNLLVYLRASPVFDVGIYVVMLQVISSKFLRFLPVLLVIICGFGFTYWMLLQYQPVYGTPIEALMRTGLMLFDLGYEDRLYDPSNGGQGYYTLVYVIFMLTAIACSIFVINLLIGLAVGEIPTLLTQGTLWRLQILYNLLSDYEILRIRMVILFDCLTRNMFRHRQIPWFRPRPYSILQKDELVSPMGKLGALWNYTEKHFFNEQIQDNIKLPTESTEKKE